MVKRILEKYIQNSLKKNSSVALLGPRQVGKTTMALQIIKSIPSVYLDLEKNLDLKKIEDIHTFFKNNNDKLIVLDEVQRVPEVFSQIRGIIDKERQKGRKTGIFLFLGSASIDLLKQSSESLAGRISFHELFTINLFEFAKNKFDKTNQLWLRGGFPNSLLSEKDEDSLDWRRNFIKTYLERDIPQLGPRIPAETLERFWIMLAHNQGAVFNASQMSRNIEVSGVTIKNYLDLMVDLLLVRKIKPYTFNIGKRLVKAPKVYVRDSGITHALLNIKNYNELLGHPVVGGSWEGFVIENIISIATNNVKVYYYRTADGAEIDLVLEFGITDLWAIEIKRNSAPNISKGFYIACDDINATRKYVVYSGQETFGLKNDVTLISLYDMMHIINEYS
jgi:uncharacterized protein